MTTPIREWSTTQRWLYAIKPASWPKLLVPMVLGQALGIFVSGSVDLLAVLAGFVFTVFQGLFIVLMNDWGDQHVDKIKRSMFPEGCSPKTIPDGILPPRQVFIAGTLAGGLAVFAAWFFGAALDRPALLPIGALCVGLFVAYTLPPLKLNYRGGGELLEAIGVGFALPWLCAYAQSGIVWTEEYLLFGGTMLLALASAIASGLSDEMSDGAGGKRTFTTIFGNRPARAATELCVLVAPYVWLISTLRTEMSFLAVIVAAIVVRLHFWRMRRVSPEAETNAFGKQKVYKTHLHFAIWYGTLALSGGLLLQYLLG